MYNTLKVAFDIQNAWSFNAFVYRLQRIPVVKKIIPTDIYAKTSLKTIIKIIIMMYKCISPFLGKAVYIAFMVMMPMKFMNKCDVESFISTLMMLSITGALLLPDSLSAKMKKYNCVNLMHMDAKDYTLSHYTFSLIVKAISFFVISVVYVWYITNRIDMLNIVYVAMMVIIIISITIAGECMHLFIYEKSRKIISEKASYMVMVSCVGLLTTYACIYYGITFPLWLTGIITIFSIILAGICVKYLKNTSIYKVIYKRVVTVNKVVFNFDEMVKDANKEMYSKVTSTSKLPNSIDEKSGCDYLNSIFFFRYKKLLLNSPKKLSIIYLIICLGFIALCVFVPPSRKDINEFLRRGMPYFVFIMYVANNTKKITQAMFFNCDHSLLTYKFYKDPDIILSIFVQRIKTCIRVNIMPSGVLAIGVPVILYISGGANSIMIYPAIFFYMMFLGILFTVNEFTMYYLLQPYDINMKEKSSAYSIITFIIMGLCYMCINLKADIYVFSIGVIILTLLYTTVSLFLVYKFAPKTFKLK